MHWGTFIACNIPREHAIALMEQVKTRLGRYSKYVAWHEPEYLHITIHFLGWINDNEIEDIKKEIKYYVDIETLPVIQILGWDERDRYLVISVKNDGCLHQMQEAIKLHLRTKGILVKEQEFIPHISLGRIAPENHINFESLDFKTMQGIKIENLKVALYESISKSTIL